MSPERKLRLVKGDTSTPPWMEWAACRGSSPDLFFPNPSEEASEAKRICAACPVRVQCLEYAVDNGELFGIWGGMGRPQRDAYRKARRSVS